MSRSEHLKLSSGSRSDRNPRLHPDEEDSGSEVELNTLSRKDVIYETRRISVQFSPVDDRLEHSKQAS